MPIKRLYHKLTDEPEAMGFDADTLEERRKEAELKGQRLQLVVYTALFAFIVLAAYGYYLIFNLTHDVHALTGDVRQMTQSVNQMTLSVNGNMDIIARNMVQMQASTLRMADTVSVTMPAMSKNTSSMTKSVQDVNTQIRNMNQNMTVMSHATVGMQRDMWSMNQTVANPVESFFDSMKPWGNRRGNAPGSMGPLPYPMVPLR